MIERILKHMNIYREMKNAAIPLNLIGKKGEDSCMNAARLVNQQELSSLMEGLNEETISSLMDDPEILSYLGKMNKKDFSILEPDRIRMVIECAGNEKLSEFPYKKIEKVLADKEIPDRIVYVYLKYYACLLSCFDANKKIIFIKHNSKIVFRAILRLTKGSFVAADERKTIEFVDVTAKSEPHENKAEELVLFLERYYQSGLSEQEIRKAVNLTAMLVKEKAEKLGARLVLSSSYKNVLENKNYVLTNFYMYISASKNGSQYLDSLGGAAGVSASGSYTCNTFLLEAEERREESL